jgi:hypothetical protein
MQIIDGIAMVRDLTQKHPHRYLDEPETPRNARELTEDDLALISAIQL